MEKTGKSTKSNPIPIHVWQEGMEQFVRSRINVKARGYDSRAEMFAASGLVQEAAEVLACITKDQYGKPQNNEDIKEELADVVFYLIFALDLFSIPLEELGDILREKLKDGHGWTDRAIPEQPSPNMTDIREGGGAKLKS